MNQVRTIAFRLLVGVVSLAMLTSPNLVYARSSKHGSHTHSHSTDSSTEFKPYSKQLGKKQAKDVNYQVIEVDGKKYKIQSVFDAKGNLTSQTVLSKDRIEFAIDKNSDGQMEHWELVLDDSRIQMHSPHGKNFMRMDVTHRLKGGNLMLKFAYNSRSEKYDLFDQQYQPFKILYYEDFVVGCNPTESNLFDTIDKISDYMAANEDLRGDLEKGLLRNSCSSPDFAKSKETILNAIMDVAGSDSIIRSDRKSGARPANKGRFLQCLRYYELDTHANRIMAAFGQYSTSVVDEDERFNWKVSCEISKNPGVYGSYDISKATVNIAKPIEELQKASSSDFQGVSARDRYAELFFHEMLHYSLIEDENMVDSIVGCCGREPTDEKNAASCKQVEDLIKSQKKLQALETEVISKIPGYADAVEEGRKLYGSNFDSVRNRQGRDIIGIIENSKTDEEAKENVKKYLNDYYSPAGDSKASNCTKESKLELSKAVAFCERERAGAMRLFGLNPNEVATTCDPSYCESTAVGNNYWFSLTVPEVRACVKSPGCGITANIQSDPDMISKMREKLASVNTDFRSEVGANPAEDREGNIPSNLTSDTETDGSNSNSKPLNDDDVKVGSGSPTYIPRDTTTSMPNYASYSGTRGNGGSQETKIRQHVETTNSVVARTKSYASNLGNQIAKISVPSALASSSSNALARASGQKKVQESTSQASPSNPLANISVPKMQVANPLSSGGSALAQAGKLGAGGRSIASAGGSALGAQPTAKGKPGLGGGKNSAPGSASSAAAGAGAQDKQKNPKVEKEKADEDSQEDEQTRQSAESFIRFLERPFEEIRSDISKLRTVNLMLKLRVRVIDPEGKEHGSETPRYTLKYSAAEGRLLVVDRPKANGEKPRIPASRKNRS